MNLINSYLNSLHIPNSWNSVHDFASWWLKSNMPMMPPHDSQIIHTEDATALCVFRKLNWQIELYMLLPIEKIKNHSHPGIELIQMRFGGSVGGVPLENGMASNWGKMDYLPDGFEHGSGDFFHTGKQGLSVLVFQKWPVNAKPTSAAIQWRGMTAGPKHAELINSHYPGVVDSTGYSRVVSQHIAFN